MEKHGASIPRRYILNSAVITTPGTYQYITGDAEKARRWLAEGEYTSTIGYQETCDALAAFTGVSVACNRQQIKMQDGDEALVFRLTVRLGDPALKGKINDPDFIKKNCEIGILRKM